MMRLYLVHCLQEVEAKWADLCQQALEEARSNLSSESKQVLQEHAQMREELKVQLAITAELQVRH